MSSALKDVFQEQKMHESQEDESYRADKLSVLCFQVRDMSFVCPLADVREILEMPTITPYPVSVQGHIGIINLRGKVIPIVCPFCENPHDLLDFSEEGFRQMNEDKFRIVVFDNDGDNYGMIARHILKKEIDEVELEGNTILNIDGRPYRVLDQSQAQSNAGES